LLLTEEEKEEKKKKKKRKKKKKKRKDNSSSYDVPVINISSPTESRFAKLLGGWGIRPTMGGRPTAVWLPTNEIVSVCRAGEFDVNVTA